MNEERKLLKQIRQFSNFSNRMPKSEEQNVRGAEEIFALVILSKRNGNASQSAEFSARANCINAMIKADTRDVSPEYANSVAMRAVDKFQASVLDYLNEVPTNKLDLPNVSPTPSAPALAN